MQELIRLIQLLLPLVSINENTQSFSVITEGETIFFHKNCTMRVEEIDSNNSM